MFNKHLRIVSMSVFIILAVYLIIGCGKKGDEPVARVGGRIITVDEFEESFSRGKSKAVIKKSTLEDKKAHLDKLVEKELKIVAGYQNNLDKNENVQKKVETRLETTILRRLIDLEIIGKSIPESELKRFYAKSNKQANVQEITIKLSSRANENEKNIVMDRIAAIKSDLNNGAPFIDVMNKYSHSQKKINSQTGANTTLKITPSTENDPLVSAAFSMNPGEVSDTIRTRSGYSILKLVSIEKVDVKPYSVTRRRIRQELLRLRGKELEKNYYDYLDELRNKYEVNYPQENIETFVSQLNNDSTAMPRMNKFRTRDPFARITPDVKKLPLVTYMGGELTAEEFLESLSQYPLTRRPELDNKEDVYTMLDKQILPRELLLLEADKRNLRNDPDVKKEEKEFTESFMLSELMKTQIDDSIDVSDDSLYSYYERHKDELVDPPMREVREIFVSDLNLANEIYQKAISGHDFIALAKKYNEKKMTQKKNGYLGFIPKSRHRIGEPVFEVPVNGITKPIEIGSKYSIIKVMSEREARTKSFEESKPFIRVKASREQKEKISERWLKEMREKTKVVIYENRLKKTFADFNED